MLDSSPMGSRTRPTFVRMSEVDRAWVNRDFHLHTKYTDGKPGVEEVIARCEALGLSEIAFTEHVRKDTSWFPKFADEVREAGARARLKVFVGCETRIADFNGSLDISDEIRGLCDVVLASVHRFPGPDGKPLAFSAVPKDEFAGTEYRLALGFVRRGGADVLAHPGGMSLRYASGFPDEYYESLMRECRAAGIAIEFNASYMKDFARFAELARAIDPPVSIGSDAHAADELGTCRDRLTALLSGGA
jgi:putative hydrolase